MYKEIDVHKLSKYMAVQLDHITCIYCCQYYSVPTTAACGHSLCHTCWRQTRTCYSCAVQVDKKTLRLNTPLQIQTQHIIEIRKALELLFNINLDDFTLDTEYEQQHVQEWLANSSNQFSAPVTDLQEFAVSKLIKQNQKKLNVSIEKVKKSIISAKKVALLKSQQLTHKNTPEIVANDEVATNNNDFSSDNHINMELNEDISREQPTVNTTDAHTASNNLHTLTAKVFTQDIGPTSIESQNKTDKNNQQLNKNIQNCKVSFFKKSSLHCTYLNQNNTFNAKKSNFEHNNDSDEIEITVRIGKNLANIHIQKKEKDVKIKVISDREVQASIGNIENEHAAHRSVETIKAHQDQMKIITNSVKKPNVPVIISDKNVSTADNNTIATQSTSKGQVEKSECQKKNTTSAVHFDITESEKKEFAGEHLEFDSSTKKKDKMKSQITIKYDCSLKDASQIQHSSKNLVVTHENVEFLNDADIFDGELLKKDGKSIHALESPRSSPSAIFMPSVKSTYTQKTINKRFRELNDENPLNSKRIKVTQETIKDSKATEKKNVFEADSENINYDAVLSQVFANINADMELIPEPNNTKLPSQISNTQKSKVKNYVQRTKQNIKQQCNNKTSDLKCYESTKDNFSENVFSLLEKENNSEILITTCHTLIVPTQPPSDTSKIPERDADIDVAVGNKETPASAINIDLDEFCTPEQDDEKSVVEETPQKNTSIIRNKNELLNVNNIMKENNNAINKKGTQQKDISIQDSRNLISISESAEEIRVSALETPLTIASFVDSITHKSTPVARKMLNFTHKNVDNDPDETICPTSMVAANTTQEREFMSKAFEKTLESPSQALHGRRRGKVTKICIAGSCLMEYESEILKKLCLQRNWTFVPKHTKDLTHLVIGVNEDNESNRSVKYFFALTSRKWIVSFDWVKKCIQVNGIADEEPFEVLDMLGEPGPRRWRLSKQKLLQGFSFYCMPPYSIVDIETLKDILREAGGHLLNEASQARVTGEPALLLAEPEHTQEDRFIYLAMELQIVPMNYQWVLNSLGACTLKPIFDQLLCPASLLPPAINTWPPELITPSDE